MTEILVLIMTLASMLLILTRGVFIKESGGEQNEKSGQ